MNELMRLKKYTKEEAELIERFVTNFQTQKTTYGIFTFLRANTEPDLLPCPFCGREPEIYPSGIVHCANVYCAAWYLNRPVEEWNTRA